MNTTNTNTTELTWEGLVQLEPRLAELKSAIEKDARFWAGQPSFCANAYWFGYGHWTGLGRKCELGRLVGWERFNVVGNGILGKSAAYDLAYQTLYDTLPDCKGEYCWCA